MYLQKLAVTLEERAKLSGRILNQAEDYYFKEDSLMIVPSELTIDINYKDEVITSISEQDAIWMNSTKENLAKNYRTRIAIAIRKYKAEHSWPTLIRYFAMAVLVLTVLFDYFLYQ
jgi:hypothetical protein